MKSKLLFEGQQSFLYFGLQDLQSPPNQSFRRLQHRPLKLLCALVLITLSCDTSAEIHEQVRAALDWQLPLNNCENPRFNRSLEGILAHGGSISVETSSQTPTVFDVDHYQIDRYERKKKRWEICVSRYKSELLKHFEILKSSARYGLTKQQAETIVRKLAQIQAAVMSPEGIALEDKATPDGIHAEPTQ